TAPRTPPSVPTISASDAFLSPQTSRFLLTGNGSSVGGVPANFTWPASVPPAFTTISSYAAAGATVASTSAATKSVRHRRRAQAVNNRGEEASPPIPPRLWGG